MSNVEDLVSRIESEFAGLDKQIKEFQDEQVHVYEGRKQRLKEFPKVCERLRSVWTPRLEALARKFGDKVKVTPRVTPSERESKMEFSSPLAEIVLRFSASTDQEVHNLVLDYDLHILPILMKYEKHARLEVPLTSPDSEVVAKWIDDRIIDFVKVYFSLHQNEFYLKGHLVIDPITGTEFPVYAAAAKLEWEGKTYYFVGEQTRQEFAEQKGIK